MKKQYKVPCIYVVNDVKPMLLSGSDRDRASSTTSLYFSSFASDSHEFYSSDFFEGEDLKEAGSSLDSDGIISWDYE